MNRETGLKGFKGTDSTGQGFIITGFTRFQGSTNRSNPYKKRPFDPEIEWPWNFTKVGAWCPLG
jgi:hypothetical protein